jgi:hypothetical protein
MRISGCGLLLAAALSIAAAADSKPDFSGEWKLEPSKSDFGPMPAPDKVVQKIVHKDPALELESTQVDGGSERKLAMTYRTDGTPTKGKIGENEVVSTASWDGSVLAIESKLQIPNRTLTFKERWTMAEDRKSFTIVRVVSTDIGDLTFKMSMVPTR